MFLLWKTLEYLGFLQKSWVSKQHAGNTKLMIKPAFFERPNCQVLGWPVDLFSHQNGIGLIYKSEVVSMCRFQVGVPVVVSRKVKCTSKT